MTATTTSLGSMSAQGHERKDEAMNLELFTYNDSPVRVVTIGGEPWFVLSDLCKVLDLEQVSRVKARLDDALTRITPIADALGRTQQATVISEAGMYEVVIRSDKPEAVTFRRWITTDVLPSIRKTGSYGGARELTPDEIVAQALAITTERVKALTATVETQQARLAVAEPKADAFDRWLSSNVDYSVGHVANALALAGAKDMGRNRLFVFLHEIGWAFRSDSQWTPYQTAVDSGRLAVKLGSQLNTRTGQQFRTVTLRITPKGAVKLATLLGVMPETVATTLDATEEVAA